MFHFDININILLDMFFCIIEIYVFCSPSTVNKVFIYIYILPEINKNLIFVVAASLCISFMSAIKCYQVFFSTAPYLNMVEIAYISFN